MEGFKAMGKNVFQDLIKTDTYKKLGSGLIKE